MNAIRGIGSSRSAHQRPITIPSNARLIVYKPSASQLPFGNNWELSRTLQLQLVLEVIYHVLLPRAQELSSRTKPSLAVQTTMTAIFYDSYFHQKISVRYSEVFAGVGQRSSGQVAFPRVVQCFSCYSMRAVPEVFPRSFPASFPKFSCVRPEFGHNKSPS